MGRSILSTAVRYALIGGAVGVLAELVIPIFAQLLGLFGLLLIFLLYWVSLPLYLMVRSPDLPFWVPPLNLALWGLVVGAIVGMFRAGKTNSGSQEDDSGMSNNR